MDAPESLEDFNEFFKSQIKKYPRLSSRLVQINGDYYCKEVTDEALLQDQFKVLHD